MIRYRDIACHPVETVTSLYKWAGLNMTASSLKWVMDHARPELVTKWKDEASDERTYTIESQCQGLMKLLRINYDVFDGR